MGAYLSRPIFEPESSSGSGRGLAFGASSVQGWRTSQEDAHNCIIEFDDDDCSLFAVYDGHGGSEVSKYCSLHLPSFIKTLSSYKAGDFKQALIDAFLKFDQTLTKPETIEALKQLAQFDSADEGDEDEVREETDELQKEAHMPLEDLLEMYKKAKDIMKNKKKEKNGTDAKEENDEDSKDENSAEGNHEDSNEAVATVPDKNSQGDGKQKVVEEKKKSEQEEEKNGVADKAPKEEPEEKLKPCAAGSSSEEVASSASKAEKAEVSLPGGRSGRAAAQRARRIITDEENNNNNDDDDDSESTSEEDSDDQIIDDDDDDDDGEDGEGIEDSDSEEEDDDDDDDDDGLGSDGIEVFDSDVPGSGSGSTAVVALLKGNLLTVANAGDSRAVVCRKGKAIDMSIDHKPEDTLERMRIERAGGKITADGRVNRGLNLSRAIGDHAYKQNKQLPLAEQMISPRPDVRSLVIDRQTDEFLILACDGIWNCMTSQEVCDFVSACHRQGDKLTDICEQLFRRCIAPDTTGDGTGCDNMTCIIVRLSKESAGEKRPSEEGSQEEQKTKKARSEEPPAANTADGNGSGSTNNQ